jgi:hypothetical protein
METSKRDADVEAGNRSALKALAIKITVENHIEINRRFKTTLGTESSRFFEHFVGLLRNIAHANELDVMLYFNGREDDSPVEDAHRALQFKLCNINPKDGNLDNVIAHETGM